MKNLDRYDYILCGLSSLLCICLTLTIVSGVELVFATIDHNENKVRYEVTCLAQGGYTAIEQRDGEPWLQCRNEKDNSVIDIQVK